MIIKISYWTLLKLAAMLAIIFNAAARGTLTVNKETK